MGAAFYFLVMIRGTQILMQQTATTTDGGGDNNNGYRGRLADLIPLSARYDSNFESFDWQPPGQQDPPDYNQYFLRSHHYNKNVDNHNDNPNRYLYGEGSDAMNKAPKAQSPEQVQQAVEQRIKERRTRTRPPLLLTPTAAAAAATYYEIVPPEQRPDATHSSSSSISPTTKKSFWQRSTTTTTPTQFRLANATQLCGINAQKARVSNPNAFRLEDALMNTDAKVLITGIVSNPLAFHLALALKSQCGVEVLMGIDPMLSNTIQNRLQFTDRMKILASNAPRMVQPLLVPLLGLDPRVKKSKKDSSSSGGEHPLMLDVTGELNVLNFQPTHIVHLSSAMYQNPLSGDFQQHPQAPKRPPSPYQTWSEEDEGYDPSLFHIRSSLMSMEQILASTVEGQDKNLVPHLTYATASIVPPTMSPSQQKTPFSKEDVVLAYSKQADEVMADTYHSLFGTYSVGVRFTPRAVYGPWDDHNSKLSKIFEGAVKGNFSAFGNTASATSGGDRNHQDLIYVRDAVEAIITAMQYRESKATNFDLKSNSAASLSSVTSTAQSALTGKVDSMSAETLTLPGKENTRALQKLEWIPRTSLKEGILRTLAWHLDRSKPYGPPLNKAGSAVPSISSGPRTGDTLLVENSVSTCPAENLACHAGPSYLPCSSECSTKAQCQQSIFDPVRTLSRNMTEGCDAVLYTQSLGLDIADLSLQSQFEDDAEPAICNLAYVSQYSPLVNAVIEKIPREELLRLGVQVTSAFEEKLKILNGRLLYRGWILIWVNAEGPVSAADNSLLKLSPGRMFADDVLYAVFVEENFTVSPTTDDVRFLISQMDRGATKRRNIWRMVKKDEHAKSVKTRFTLAAQPVKRASVLLSQLKFKISDRGRIPQDTKISIMDAVRFMRFETGSDPTRQKESSSIRRQKDFYRRIPSFVNAKDLRDNFEPMYKYELKHWVRTRWVVHDLTLEDSRQLRCDWYQEHVQWGAEVDQLSFADVMARRIIDRRMMLLEPDDRSKKKSDVHPELKDITDNNEWFAMATEQNKVHLQQTDQAPSVQQIHGDQAKDDADEEGTDEGPEEVASETGYSEEKRPDAGLYIRVISDRIMSLSRAAWSRYRAELARAEEEAHRE